MFCQLDQVGQILKIANAVKDALQEHYKTNSDLYKQSKKASMLALGLLLMHDYDVFIKKGILAIDHENLEHYWVEIYLDGEAFILISSLKEEADYKVLDIAFMPEEEAIEVYGLSQGRDVEWQYDVCNINTWQKTLDILEIKKPLNQILTEIANLQ